MKSFLKLASIALLASKCFGQSTLASVYTECLKPGQFVLTFDDGPNVGTTEKALNVLKENGIIGTFFVNSANYVDLVNSAEARNLVKRAYEEGHDIGSHTYQHKDLFLAMDEGSLELNVDENNKVIESIIGRTPVFFRPPLGNGGFTQEYCEALHIQYDPRTEQVRQYLGERGIKVIMWNADTQDWNNKGNVQNSINELAKSVSFGSPQTNSYITLLHDVHEYTVDVILQEVINYIRQQGYEIVSLAECIGQAPYLDGYNPNQANAGANAVNAGTNDGTVGGNTGATENTSDLTGTNVDNTANFATNTVAPVATPDTVFTQPLDGTGNRGVDLDSSSIKSFVSSIVMVILLSLFNILLY